MGTFQYLSQGLIACMDPSILLLCAVGSFLGAVVGVIPCMGPGTAIAILLPLVYGKPPLPTLVMLAGIYYGSQFGGAITSIAINVPGTPSAVPTTFDGYPLMKQGKGGKAMGIAMVGSFFGGTAGVIIITLVARPLASFALKFGPPEYFAVYLFTFVAIVAVSKGQITQGIVSLALGLLVSTIGLDIFSYRPRLHFGSVYMMGGIDFLPVAVGLMGLSEVLSTIAKGEFIDFKKDDFSMKVRIKEVFPTIKEIILCLPTMIRCMFVGFFVGVLPGAGATIAAIMCYNLEERFATDRKNFGKGSLQGVSAPETANNAATTGAFVPMLTLGIPGSATTALLLGGMLLTGIQPGPGLFTRNPELVWGLIASMYVGNVMLLIMCIALIPVFIWLLKISQKTLPVIIATLCVIGVFAMQNSLFDVGVMLFFTIVGLIFKKKDVPFAPMLIACILGKDLEVTFRTSMNMFKGNFALVYTRPIAMVFIALCVVMSIYPIQGWIAGMRKRKGKPA